MKQTQERLGPSQFYVSEGKWACSSTGVFMDNIIYASYKANNSFSYELDEIYRTARLAPTSLKYYGLCLRKGSYKVRLHFAEIMFSDDQTYSSLGKRIFDVSIQGNLIWKDFNIMEEAKGPGKGITKVHDAIVSGSTLEIHLYWSGKGTNASPGRGAYGPLISAISVTPNFEIDTGLSVGAIVGIVAASCVVLLC
ncbi:probable LRR receptor-like serine/threonine-protein kinase At1g53430 [Cornus florida]|uniref:probable LRR receptor-like serine/threonine-protein kinase At1g53430 n=1 Tax=Cornus florida TaxID=4283 RepID=UPI00289E663C|nr:probable LRR receptor-like serine/threonine-protein kinase At1g53430 [Cornus florida]